MDRQEIFDIVWDHLVTKKSPKSVAQDYCVYRGPNGTMCAVGVLVTDTECYGWGNRPVDEVDLPERLEDHVDFLQEMQVCHDDSNSIEDRIQSLRTVADEYGLQVPGDA